MFGSILSNGLNLGNFAICVGVALILGIIVALVHSKTSKSNHNFVTTLAMLPSIVGAVILLVNGNLGTSVAVAGAFTLIRFRSIPGNSKEILAVFLSMAIGLAVGVGYVWFAALFAIVSCIMLIFFNLIKFGESDNTKMLKILIPEDMDYTNVFNDLFKKNLVNAELVNVKTVNMGSLFELTYEFKLKDNINEKEFIDELRVRNGNLKISLSHPLTSQML